MGINKKLNKLTLLILFLSFSSVYVITDITSLGCAIAICFLGFCVFKVSKNLLEMFEKQEKSIYKNCNNIMPGALLNNVKYTKYATFVKSYPNNYLQSGIVVR